MVRKFLYKFRQKKGKPTCADSPMYELSEMLISPACSSSIPTEYRF